MNNTPRQINLLLIEDNEGDIILTREALESRKMPKQLHVCRNGVDAIRFLENCLQSDIEALPEMILLDINLPKKNGHEVLKFIKQHEQLHHIPVIILTTSSSKSDISEAYQNKANYYMTKPVDMAGFNKIADKLEIFWKDLIKNPARKN